MVQKSDLWDRYLHLHLAEAEDNRHRSALTIIAAEIVEDLEAALQQFAAIASDLKK